MADAASTGSRIAGGMTYCVTVCADGAPADNVFFPNTESDKAEKHAGTPAFTVHGEHCALPYAVRVYTRSGDLSPQEGDRITAGVLQALEHTRITFSAHDKDSELYKVNEMAANQPHTMSADLAALLAASDSIWRLSRGLFDPTASRVGDEAGACKGQWTSLQRQGNVLTKSVDGVRLDMGGIAKGWGIDRICETVFDFQKESRAEGEVCGALVEWAGDVRVVGSKGDGTPWRVGLWGVMGDRSAPPIANLTLLSGAAVATSEVTTAAGSAHIARPSSGVLVGSSSSPTTTTLASVVVRGSATMADALATTSIAASSFTEARRVLEAAATALPYKLDDFVLYAAATSGEGGGASVQPARLVRYSPPGQEDDRARRMRLALHDPARVVVVGAGLAGFSLSRSLSLLSLSPSPSLIPSLPLPLSLPLSLFLFLFLSLFLSLSLSLSLCI